MFGKILTTTALVSLLAVQSADAGTLEIWVRNGIGDSLKEVVKAFNAGHSDQVKMTEVPASELVQKYAVAIAGGEAPDALSMDLIYTPAFSAAGQLEDLTDWAKSLPYFDALSKAHIKVGTYEGKIYGLPLALEASLFVWNKGLYSKAGLDPDKAPTTWEEITSNAEKISALGDDIYGFYFSGGGCGGCMAFTFLPLVWGAGADVLSEDGKTATLDTPEMRKAVAIYRGMVEKGYVPASAASDAGSNFMSINTGKIGQQISGAFTIGQLKSGFPDIDFGVSLIPGVDGHPSSFAGGDNFVITKGSPNAEIAKTFLEYTYSLEGQKIMATHGGLPTRSDLAADALSGLDPRMLVGIEAIKVASTPYTLQYNDLFNSVNGPWSAFTHGVFYSNDVDEVFAASQDEMQQIIDDAQ